MRVRELVFLGVVVGVAAALHGYVGWSLVARSSLSAPWSTAAWILLGAMTLWIPLTFLGGRMLGPSPLRAALVRTGFVSMGAILVLFPLALLRDVLWAGASLVAGPALDARVDGPGSASAAAPGRRGFLLDATGLAVLGTSAWIGLIGLAQARRRPRVVRVPVPIADLPPDLEGFRIVQISDLHVVAGQDPAFLRGVVDDVLALRPDVVAVTGDLVDGRPDELRELLQPLADLRAPHGVYFVTGNHEYYWNAEAWVALVRDLGLTVLLNEHRLLPVGDARLVLAGVTDVSAGEFVRSHRSDPAGALAGAPEADLRVLLAHQPKSFTEAVRAGYDLQLSGHTHGGQFFPWNLLIHLVQPVVAGLVRVEDTWIHVNRGTGTWGPPLRAGVPAEISEVVLTREG